MSQTGINQRALDAIERYLATTNYTEKRNLLSTAIFALQPDPDARMAGAIGFSEAVDELLTKPPNEIQSAVLEAAGQVWQ